MSSLESVLLHVSLGGLLFLVVLLAVILIIMFRGAPYVPSQKKTVWQMTEMANVHPGERAIDLGSGDGRVVIALARAGAEAHGYEINPLLVWLGRREIRKAGLGDRAFIHWKDFWSVDFSTFDIVTVFGISHIMGFLRRKCRKELKASARVVANSFPFSRWPHTKKVGEVYLYERGKL
jgi:cyclopropane fatty-acyl-phospholipid synthase-like methyltransferase